MEEERGMAENKLNVSLSISIICLIIKFVYLDMTLEQRKIELINWIINTSNEKTISKIEEVAQNDDSLPEVIKLILKDSASEPLDDCIEHSSTKDLL